MQYNAVQFKIKHILSHEKLTDIVQSFGGRVEKFDAARVKVDFLDHSWGWVELDGFESIVEIPDSCGEPWTFKNDGDYSVFGVSRGRVVSCEKIAEIPNFDPTPARSAYEKRRDEHLSLLTEDEKYL